MKYPKIYRNINRIAGIISGSMIFLVAVFATMEVILRSVFNNPTRWSLNTSEYLLLFSIFSGVSYSLESKGQVAVDMIRDALKKKGRILELRAIAVLSNLLGLVVAGVFVYNGVLMIQSSIRYGKLTTSAVQIPEIILDIGITLGSCMLALTLIFILLDVLSESEEFL